jgi:ankyrin repeat protein
MRKTGFFTLVPLLILVVASVACFAGANDDLFAAIKARDIGRVRKLLASGANVNAPAQNFPAAAYLSPLAYAVREGDTEIARLLLDKGADVNFTHPMFGSTPLIEAAKQGNVEMVGLLLAKGAEISAQDNNLSNTALTFAASFGHTGTVKLLLDHGVPVDEQNGEGATALQLAASTDHSELVRLLLDRGADLNHKDIYWQTALFYAACRDCQLENARLLLDRGTNVNQRDFSGRTPLFDAACADCNPRIARLLLARGADVNAQNSQGRTAFYYARLNANRGVIAVLVKAGANGGKMPALPHTRLKPEDIQFLADQCKIEQPDIDVIPRLNIKTRKMLMAEIAMQDCELLVPFTISRGYYRQIIEKAPMPSPRGWDPIAYLTGEEIMQYQKITGLAP